jgi:hypothetical protein
MIERDTDCAPPNNRYFIRGGTTVSYIVNLDEVTIYQTVVNEQSSPYNPSKILRCVFIPSKALEFEISEEEYNRIEKLLCLNNKEELNYLKSHIPQLDVRQAIMDLQVNEE